MKRRNFLRNLYTFSLLGFFPSILFAKGKPDLLETFNRTKGRKRPKNTLEKLKILIPLYSYPTPNEEGYVWQPLIDLKRTYPNVEIVAVVNPSNGHFREVDSNYYEGIQNLVDANIQVVGYVYTQYGQRLSTEVVEDIQAWQDFYQSVGVSGIFLDETSTDPTNLNYYSTLSQEAKDRGLNFIVMNPGITTDQSYIDANIANVIVSYENPNRDLTITPPSTYNTPTETTKLSLLIYEMEDNTVDDLITFAQEHQFSYIYFTDDGFDGNPWDSLSYYLEEQIVKIMA